MKISPQTQLEQAQFALPVFEKERALLDQLLSEAKVYHSGKEFEALLDFTVRLRNFAPFNAMLLQIQKRGLQYAASRKDWEKRFNRVVKENARPLLILWPFGPVALVYDLLDTEGEKVPDDAFAFYVKGAIDENRMSVFRQRLAKLRIFTTFYDAGDGSAGMISRRADSANPKVFSEYTIGINRNHSAETNFATLAHELAHLFLGHLGDDLNLRTKARSAEKEIEELEAESVAYIVCRRNGLEPNSQRYLSDLIEQDLTTENMDLYAIMKAAGMVERHLDLSIQTAMR